MSNLWKAYLENDLERFQKCLATISNRTGQDRKASVGFGASGSAQAADSYVKPASSTPKSSFKARKASTPTVASQASIRSDLNQRDQLGLTILHHACSSDIEQADDFALSLIENPYVDLYLQDFENGWTALHRALYFGKIKLARAILLRDARDASHHDSHILRHHGGGLIKIKDHEGHSPFDVYRSTVKDPDFREPELGRYHRIYEATATDSDSEAEFDEIRSSATPAVININGDEVFMFGSNKNLTLGFGDQDDRQYPERATLHRTERLTRLFFEEQEKQITKKDPLHVQYVPEHSLQAPIDTMPILVRNRPFRILNVALSKLHSAILTDDPESNLYMCGFNSGGRLGTGDENTRFKFTCIDGGALFDKQIVAVGLGQNHTLAISAKGETFSWGLNGFGQLGYSLPNPKSTNEEPMQLLPRRIFGPIKHETVIGAAASRIHSVVHTTTSLYTFGKNVGQLGIVDSDSNSLQIQTTPRKVAAAHFSAPIKTVSAIERATICLLENHDVWIFANFGYTKLVFPIDTVLRSTLNGDAFTVGRATSNIIVKIASGGDTLCALTESGDLWSVKISETEFSGTSTTGPNKIRNALSPPQRIWSAKRADMAIRDMDVSQDSEVIICTTSGSVWRRVPRTNLKTVFGEQKGKHKFARVPGLTRIAAVRSNNFGAFAAIRADLDLLNHRVLINDPSLWEHIAPLLSFHRFRGFRSVLAEGSSAIEDPAFWTLVRSGDIEPAMEKYFSTDVGGRDSDYDVLIGSTVTSVKIPAHQFMLSARSSVLRELMVSFRATGSAELAEVLKIKMDADKILILFDGLDFLTILNLLCFIYLDGVVDVWNYTRLVPECAYRYRQVRSEIMKTASKLDIKMLENAAKAMRLPPKTLHKDLRLAFADMRFFDDADVLINTSDGQIPAHSILLCARCPFFEGLFHGRAAGDWLRARRTDPDEESRVTLDFQHVSTDIFNLVLRFLYTDETDFIFEEAVSDDMDDYRDYVIEILALSNELMLDRLSQSCQQSLARVTSIRNVSSLLNAVSPCSETAFKDAGLEYIAYNMEGLLENHLLDELDDDLLPELEDCVKRLQFETSPRMRSGEMLESLMERNPKLEKALLLDLKEKIDYFECLTRAEDEFPMKRRTTQYDLASSPLQSHQRRNSMRSPRIAPTSPVIIPSSDLLFDMDDVDSLGARRSSQSLLSPPTHGLSPVPQRNLRDPSMIAGRPYTPSRSPNEQLTPSLTSPTSSPVLARATTAPFSSQDSSTAWQATAPLASTKLGIKEIMDQAASNKVSSLSLEIKNTRPITTQSSSSFSGKLSQKERKKLLQQQALQMQEAKEQQNNGPFQLVGGAKSQAKSPWNPIPTTTLSTSGVVERDLKGKNPDPVQHIISPSRQPSKAPLLSRPPAASLAAGRTALSPQEKASKSRPSDMNSKVSFNKGTKLSMAAIMDEEQQQIDEFKASIAKRSLLEIQQEQEFEAWWDQESRKVSEAQAAAEAAASKTIEKDGRPRNGGGGGGGGRSTRGKGRRGRGQGQPASVR